MATFSDKAAYQRNYYDVTGTEKAAKGKPVENNSFQYKKLFVSLGVVAVLLAGVGIASGKALSDRKHFDNTMQDNVIYLEGYNDGLSESMDESNATDSVYMEGYKDGVADR